MRRQRRRRQQRRRRPPPEPRLSSRWGASCGVSSESEPVDGDHVGAACGPHCAHAAPELVASLDAAHCRMAAPRPEGARRACGCVLRPAACVLRCAMSVTRGFRRSSHRCARAEVGEYCGCQRFQTRIVHCALNVKERPPFVTLSFRILGKPLVARRWAVCCHAAPLPRPLHRGRPPQTLRRGRFRLRRPYLQASPRAPPKRLRLRPIEPWSNGSIRRAS